MKKLLAFLALLLLAPALMAPACADSGAPSYDTSQQLTTLLCAADGTLLGLGYVVVGSSLYACQADVYEVDCTCPDGDPNAPALTKTALLAVPPQALDPSGAVTTCWAQATENPYPDVYYVQRTCGFYGVYQPGPEGPQATHPDLGVGGSGGAE